MQEDLDTHEQEATLQPSEAVTYVLDHFEDGGWAVLEDEHGYTFNLPHFWLPGDLSEGEPRFESTKREQNGFGSRETARRLETLLSGTPAPHRRRS